MRIGEVAAASGLPSGTVRYYERRGLIPIPPRAPSGYREYPADTVERLRFIRRAQDFGFTLQQIRELLELRARDASTCSAVEVRTRAKIEDVRRRIRELERLETVLERLAASCAARTPSVDCPVLEMLSEEGG